MLVQVVQGSSPDLSLFRFVSKSFCFTVDGKVASLDDFKMIDAQMAEEIIQTLQLLLGAKQPQDETKPPLHGQDSHVPTALTCSHMFSTVKFVCFFVFLCVALCWYRERASVGRKLVSAQKLRQAVAEAHGARGAYGASEALAWYHHAVLLVQQ